MHSFVQIKSYKLTKKYSNEIKLNSENWMLEHHMTFFLMRKFRFFPTSQVFFLSLP